jgi:simple sugar transport system permease protein
MMDLLAGTIRTATPLLLAALGGLICERCGVFNIALEGLMLFGAFFAIFGVYLTGNPFFGVLFAISATTALAFIFSMLHVKGGANPIIAAIGINMLALGATTFSMKMIFGDQGSVYSDRIVGLKRLDILGLNDLPVLGPIFSGHSPTVYLSWLLVAVCAVFLYKTTPGINLRMVGEAPKAAQTAGIPIDRVKIAAVSVGGVFCALAGVHLSMGYVTMFTENMTAGRGFIAFTAVVFGKADPVKVLIASLIFGFAESLGYRIQQYSSIPSPLVMMLPYVITVIALMFRGFHKINAGKPFEGAV